MDGYRYTINSKRQLKVIPLVKVEGTLNELRELFGDAKRTVRSVKSATEEVVKTAKKSKRKLSEWNKYIARDKNKIFFKRGPKKGRLDLAKMSAAFKRSKKNKK